MSDAFERLTDIVAQLRAPNGCPWDRKQTHATLKTYLLEETYEVLDTIDQDNPSKLREELGDVLLQIFLHAQIESERDQFTIQDVVHDLTTKLIRRHPHVFEPSKKENESLNTDQVLSQWEHIKRIERETNGKPSSILESIPQTLPALQRAWQTQKRASRVGFDWTEPLQVIDKLDEELNELREAVRQTMPRMSEKPASKAIPGHSATTEVEHEFGDVLFTMANMARFLKINPEEALRKANHRFTTRFQFMESQIEEAGRDLQALTPEEWEQSWEDAKRHERTVSQENPLTT